MRSDCSYLPSADLLPSEVLVAAAAQKPIMGSIFSSAPKEAAWKTIPSWYLVTRQDKAINPELERLYAKRINATTLEVNASHAVFVSHPGDVARIIQQAARATATIKSRAK
jgi:pimeloyl-ACP methyl ester carboxylesterase